jgi:hypothetical protein
MKRVLVLSFLAIFASILAFSSVAMADTLFTYGATAVIPTPGSPANNPPPQPYVWQFTSDTSGLGYAGMGVAMSGSLTPATLTSLSAEYWMAAGAFGGGAPRFSLVDSSNNEAYLYWGTSLGGGSFSDPNGGTQWGNTGNYADLLSSDARVYSNGFGGDNNPNVGVTWAQFLATGSVSSTQIADIYLDVDGGFTGTQVLDVSTLTINDTDYHAPAPAPEPSTLVLLGSGILGLAGIWRKKIIG